MEKDDRDIGRKGIEPAKEKQKGKKGGRNCRKKRERSITPSPSQAAREEEGTNPRPSSSRLVFLVLAGNRSLGGGVLFEPSPLSSTHLSVPLHTFTQKPGGLQVGSLGNGGYRTWGPIRRAARELSKGTSTHVQYIFSPGGGVCLH